MLTHGYGVWESLLFIAVSDSILYSVKYAAEKHNVCTGTIVRWRKVLR
jgi:hypothetical protein